MYYADCNILLVHHYGSLGCTLVLIVGSTILAIDQNFCLFDCKTKLKFGFWIACSYFNSKDTLNSYLKSCICFLLKQLTMMIETMQSIFSPLGVKDVLSFFLSKVKMYQIFYHILMPP